MGEAGKETLGHETLKSKVQESNQAFKKIKKAMGGSAGKLRCCSSDKEKTTSLCPK